MLFGAIPDHISVCLFVLPGLTLDLEVEICVFFYCQKEKKKKLEPVIVPVPCPGPKMLSEWMKEQRTKSFP